MNITLDFDARRDRALSRKYHGGEGLILRLRCFAGITHQPEMLFLLNGRGLGVAAAPVPEVLGGRLFPLARAIAARTKPRFIEIPRDKLGGARPSQRWN